MEAGKKSVIYTGLIPGPIKADEICRKMMVTGMMHRGFTVYAATFILHNKEIYAQ
jgi:hypothetical protein